MLQAALSDDFADRWFGSFFGLAIGDQLGSRTEGKAPGTFEPLTDMSADTFWTDDTAQALCLADSLTACCGFDLNDQAQRLCAWLFDGYLACHGEAYGCGPTAKKALHHYRENAQPGPVADEKTNGPLMRLAPIPLFYSDDLHHAIRLSATSATSTHSNPVCLDACRLHSALIIKALHGADKETVLRYDEGLWQQAALSPTIDAIARGSYAAKGASEVRGTLQIDASLEAALFAFNSTDSLPDALLCAVNLGHDADTTAAVCGQLAGAYYGYRALPQSWLKQLKQTRLIEYVALRLYEAKSAKAR